MGTEKWKGTWSKRQESGVAARLGDGVAPVVHATGNGNDDSGKNRSGRAVDDADDDGSQLLGVEVSLGLGDGLKDVALLLGNDVIGRIRRQWANLFRTIRPIEVDGKDMTS